MVCSFLFFCTSINCVGSALTVLADRSISLTLCAPEKGDHSVHIWNNGHTVFPDCCPGNSFSHAFFCCLNGELGALFTSFLIAHFSCLIASRSSASVQDTDDWTFTVLTLVHAENGCCCAPLCFWGRLCFYSYLPDREFFAVSCCFLTCIASPTQCWLSDLIHIISDRRVIQIIFMLMF